LRIKRMLKEEFEEVLKRHWIPVQRTDSRLAREASKSDTACNLREW